MGRAKSPLNVKKAVPLTQNFVYSSSINVPPKQPLNVKQTPQATSQYLMDGSISPTTSPVQNVPQFTSYFR